jgi:hypothetical protein
MDERECHERSHGVLERNMDLSVIVFMQLAASGDGHRLHRAANQFFYLQLQTRHVLLEVVHAVSVPENRTDFLHQPAVLVLLPQNEKPFARKDLAPGGQRQLLPLLHAGFASARRLLSKPPKLEATKRHPVGHLKLQHATPITQ